MRRIVLLMMLCLLPCIAISQDKTAQLDGAEIRELIAKSGAEVVAVAIHDLETGRELLIDERRSLHAASTMKLPVMLEIFRLADEGRLRLTDQLPVIDRFPSIVDGSEYRLQPDSDSDQDIYRRIGEKLTILELMERMITQSSNLATNILIVRVGPEKVNENAHRLGASDIEVRRGVEDTKAFRAGLNNTTTARDLMLLFRAIAEGKSAKPESTRQMISILAAQHFNEGIPAGLPKGLRVAHKTGQITAHHHDAGIVFPPNRRPYVIVVLTKGIAEGERSARLIADISRLVYESIVGLKVDPGRSN